MGIDGIGGGGFKPGGPGAPGPSASGDVGGAEKAGRRFELESGQADAPVATTAASEAATELDQVRNGELSLDQYLNQRVELAVQHLDGKLAADQLDLIRDQLRQQLLTDPVLQRLVESTTGGSVAPDS